jgi:signal transduction histidine kinase
VSKSALDELLPAIRRALHKGAPQASQSGMDSTATPTEQLINVVQELSLARDLDTVMAIVRRAARALTGADGATFVLRDRDQCYYAEEDAIEPLWKGKRFPMSACISGWTMLNKQAAVIEDIYSDARIPVDAYRPTFVKSLAMVPIRATAPVGAIGNYWASRHKATPEELRLLQALANSTAIAMENVQLYSELEQRVQERTSQLEAANKELHAFSYSVSHDLRAPLRHIEGFSKILSAKAANQLDDANREYLRRICNATASMQQLIDDMLRLSKITQAEINKELVDLGAMAKEIVVALQADSRERRVEFTVEEPMLAHGDPHLLHVALENLLANAWKYTSKNPQARIKFGRRDDDQGQVIYSVQDNGAGFDMAYADKLFGPFQRLHTDSEFPGTGVGLATVQRVIHKHGGRIWAQAAPDAGATFSFTLPNSETPV